MKYVNVPIKVAKDIANKFKKNQVIIVCWDKTHGKTHVVTYGVTKEECKQAALGGAFVKKALGWPQDVIDTTSTPERLK